MVVDLRAATATGVRMFLNVEAFVGGSATDTLFGPDATTAWQITGMNAGLAGTAAFSNFENLVGGVSDDTFQFGDGKAVTGTIDGGAGLNALDYSPCTVSVNVNLAKGAATGVGRVTNFRDITGGSGADLLIGDDDDNVLIGGPGDDLILGLRGRDILVGGLGADLLDGGEDDDLLLNGTTSYDGAPANLAGVRAEWRRTDVDYATRIAHLRGELNGGLNGSVELTASTVFDDYDVDWLLGEAGQDWFWSPLAELIDQVAGEQVK
ncbi:MAG: hypothetical protein U0790_02030 [Isosphaeraceae bacterium]